MTQKKEETRDRFSDWEMEHQYSCLCVCGSRVTRPRAVLSGKSTVNMCEWRGDRIRSTFFVCISSPFSSVDIDR